MTPRRTEKERYECNVEENLENEKLDAHSVSDETWAENNGAEINLNTGKKQRSWLFETFFPRLREGGGKTRSRGRSVAILSALYFSHVFSSWGDRMWQFLVTLLLALLYPGSLLLPAIFGLVWAILPALLGTVLGDFVDRNPRLRVVCLSLLIQNSLVCACAVGLAVLFGLDLGICGDVPLYLFIILTGLVIILGAVANLATVVNTIAKEKDWIVVIANKDKAILSNLNANMRRIDLICKLLAPATAGAVLQFTGPLTTTFIIGGWNVASFFGELWLVMLVYRWVPELKYKRLRAPSNVLEKPPNKLLMNGVNREIEEIVTKEEGKRKKLGSDDGVVSSTTLCSKLCSGPKSLYISLKDGWVIYWNQKIALAGISLALIYLTVLGFSGVTATYLLTQGVPNVGIGIAQGFGAIIGVTGTFVYPHIQKRIGTVKTGMFGISSQLSMLLLCLMSVVIPGERVANEAEGYYYPNCPLSDNSSLTFYDYKPTSSSTFLSLTPSNLPYTDSLPVHLTKTAPMPTQSLSLQRNYVPSSSNVVSYSSSLSAFPSPTPTATNNNGPWSVGLANVNTSIPLISPAPSSSVTEKIHLTPETEGLWMDWNIDRILPLAFMIAGITLARFGLWIFDLAIQQRVQETVPEDERGAVGGIMNAMNCFMDTMHYVLIIAAPRPEHFSILTIISIVMVTLGALLYALYLCYVSGHFQWITTFQRFMAGGGKRRKSIDLHNQLDKSDPNGTKDDEEPNRVFFLLANDQLNRFDPDDIISGTEVDERKSNIAFFVLETSL